MYGSHASVSSSESPSPASLALAEGMLSVPNTAAALTAAMAAAAAGIPAPSREEPAVQPPATDQHESRWAKTQFKSCGVLCEKDGCRRMFMRHQRGMVCTLCMPQTTWRRCDAAGCQALIHADCALHGQSWVCPHCNAQPPCPAITSNLATQPNQEGFQHFSSENEAYTCLQQKGFRVNNTQPTGKTWDCRCCDKMFYVKKCKDGHWSCPLDIKHAANCTNPKSVVKLENASDQASQHVRYQNDFAAHPGLLEFIEILGCSGECRQDQIQRAITRKFNVFVESQLLYRTAKNAHEEMFGSTISDVLELLKMEEEVKEAGGFLKLFLGDSVHPVQILCLCDSVHSTLCNSNPY